MRNPKRVTIGMAALLSLAVVSLLAAAVASARDGHGRRGGGRTVLSASLAPSVPTDPKLHGVAAGGAPWVLDRGSVRLRADGRIHLEVEGLVIPIAHGTFPAGTARPVTTVSASLFCGADASGPAATTASVPISEGGDAEIDDRLALPSTCLAPIVLVHPNGNLGAYIALTGWRT